IHGDHLGVRPATETSYRCGARSRVRETLRASQNTIRAIWIKFLKIENLPQILCGIEDFYRGRACPLWKAWPIPKHLFNCRLRVVDTRNETESAFWRQIFFGASVLRNDRSPHREKGRRPIAHASGSPRYVHAFDCCEFGKRASHVSAIQLRATRDAMRIDNMPSALLQTRPLRVVCCDVHR